MAATTFHVRSNSFPSTSHPLVSEFDDQLCRLRQSQAASTSSSSICQKLNGLQDVYDCVDKLIQLPSTQQAMIHYQNELLDNELLDGSLRLFDLCNTAKDSLSQMKESVSELQSAIRRRQGDLVAETKRYLNSRKVVKKAIQKALKDTKKTQVSANSNEFAEVDACLKTSKSSEEIQAQLKNLQPCIQDLEEGVESLFRCLIKTRASILNVHNL
ncbi:hypothetical protein LINGRAHAP2_LOCUS4140 [Linum grandiflorum]